ncbi:unnamed protein product [Microthlaspi erraticum]|uniref:COPA/B second beta-propeller domain-containing protein n=1 Tax=Microthlaspi erraticum TaxID=1685480 RepID=A0A6D2I2X0_9BRAS|nr:unnamed protein product [Microthlaspi erraticum]
MPLIFSASDDQQVRVWEWNENSASQIRTLQGHADNVSSVLFHAQQNLLVSNSDHRGIRLWGVKKITDLAPPITVPRLPRYAVSFKTESRLLLEEHRVWSLAVHPEFSVIAGGLDSGMMVFRLVRERPVFAVGGDFLFFQKANSLFKYDFSTRQEPTVVLGPGSELRTLSYCPQSNALLSSSSDADGDGDQLYKLPSVNSERVQLPNGTTGLRSSAFLGTPGVFAVLHSTEGNMVAASVYDPQNSLLGSVRLYHGTHSIYSAESLESLLCINDSGAVKVNFATKEICAGIKFPRAKSAVWSGDMERVAFLSKHSICVSDKYLELMYIINDSHVKSAAWNEHGVLFYSTLTEISYRCRNDDTGTRPLHLPLYITKVSGGVIFCLNRNADVVLLDAKNDVGYEPVDHQNILGTGHVVEDDADGNEPIMGVLEPIMEELEHDADGYEAGGNEQGLEDVEDGNEQGLEEPVGLPIWDTSPNGSQ